MSIKARGGEEQANSVHPNGTWLTGRYREAIGEYICGTEWQDRNIWELYLLHNLLSSSQ